MNDNICIMKTTSILYSTSHCHLCEQAKLMLDELAKTHNLEWEVAEIADDVSLLNLYEVKIPVLKRLDNGAELNWPFNIEDISQFIS